MLTRELYSLLLMISASRFLLLGLDISLAKSLLLEVEAGVAGMRDSLRFFAGVAYGELRKSFFCRHNKHIYLQVLLGFMPTVASELYLRWLILVLVASLLLVLLPLI
jgi:hypothetical protein